MQRDAERRQDDLAETDEEDKHDERDERAHGGDPPPGRCIQGRGQGDEYRQSGDGIDDDPDRDEVVDEVTEHAEPPISQGVEPISPAEAAQHGIRRKT